MKTRMAAGAASMLVTLGLLTSSASAATQIDCHGPFQGVPASASNTADRDGDGAICFVVHKRGNTTSVDDAKVQSVGHAPTR